MSKELIRLIDCSMAFDDEIVLEAAAKRQRCVL